MSWHCSRALVEAFSEANYWVGGASSPWSEIPMHAAYCWPDKTMEYSGLFRFGMTCAPLTESLGVTLLTWCLVASRAKTFPLLAKAQELTGSAAGYGQKWRASLAKFDLASSGWKIPPVLLVEDLAAFSATWPKWGSMRNGECWERDTPMLTTRGTGYGYLPTPTASNTKAHHMRGADKGKPREPRSYGAGGPLNPRFLEWHMGWPVGWTKLEPLETVKYREWLQQHFPFLPDVPATSNKEAA